MEGMNEALESLESLLRAIEQGPHDPACCGWAFSQTSRFFGNGALTIFDPARGCDCWKSQALERARKMADQQCTTEPLKPIVATAEARGADQIPERLPVRGLLFEKRRGMQGVRENGTDAQGVEREEKDGMRFIARLVTERQLERAVQKIAPDQVNAEGVAREFLVANGCVPGDLFEVYEHQLVLVSTLRLMSDGKIDKSVPGGAE